MSNKRKLIHRCSCENCQRHPYNTTAQQHQAINRVLATLDEKRRRRFVGLLAHPYRRGSIQALHEITGLSRTTIRRGQAEIRRTDRINGVRRTGGGRIAIEKNIPTS